MTGLLLLGLPAYPDEATARDEVGRFGLLARLTASGHPAADMVCSAMCSGVGVIFDDEHLVANAGLIQPATPAQPWGFGSCSTTGSTWVRRPGTPTLSDKAMPLVHSALAHGDSISDTDALRAGSSGAVLGHGLRAPSTLPPAVCSGRRHRRRRP